jgi:hypothetical protein
MTSGAVTIVDTPRPPLSSQGQINITLAAARQYSAASKRTHDETLGIEEARRELLELLSQAVRVEGDTEAPERWRFRRKSERIDITARVVREGAIMSVVSVTARPYG